MRILLAITLFLFNITVYAQIPIRVFDTQRGDVVLQNSNIAPLLTGLGNTIYVAKNGSDTLCTGTLNCPYLTVQKAINSISAGMSIYIFPGTYSENVVMRDVEGVAIFGSSEQNTTITNAIAGHTFSWVAAASTGASVTTFRMQDITLANNDTTNTYHALHIDGNAITSPNTFLADEADFNFVDIDGDGTQGHVAAYFRNAGNIYYTHGATTGDLYMTNISQFAGRQVEVGTLIAPQNATFEYLGGNAATGLGRSNMTLAQQSVVYGNVAFSGHPLIQFDQTSLIVGNVTGTLTSYYASGKDYCPTLIMYNQFGLLGGSGGNITLTFPDPQTSGSAFNYMDLSESHFPNASAIALTKAAFLPATSRGVAIIQADGAAFGTATFTANGYIAADIRGSSFTQANLAVTSAATIDRDKHVLSAISTASTPTAVTITPPFPSTATIDVSTTPNTNTTTWVTSKAVTGFSINLGTAGGTVDAVVIRQ
jgi:hypothetical protein